MPHFIHHHLNDRRELPNFNWLSFARTAKQSAGAWWAWRMDEIMERRADSVLATKYEATDQDRNELTTQILLQKRSPTSRYLIC